MTHDYKKTKIISIGKILSENIYLWVSSEIYSLSTIEFGIGSERYNLICVSVINSYYEAGVFWTVSFFKLCYHFIILISLF